jgi:exosome complex component RRP41
LDVVLEVLQDHGGAVAAAINAVSLALIDAGVPMKDRVVAVTVGVQDDRVLVDLSQAEADKAAAQAVVLVACYVGSGGLVLCECEAKVPIAGFNAALEAGQAACGELGRKLREVVVEKAREKCPAQFAAAKRR